MKTRTEPNDTYLAPTELCDHDNPWVRAQAESVVDHATAPTERALKVFRHVRDHVRFSPAYSRSRASQILRRGYGDCGNKTNAQVALFRAVGIPARLRWVRAQTEILHYLVEQFIYKKMPPVASHFWCECYLDGTWVSCESLLDRSLYQGMLAGNLITRAQVPSIDWDGDTDLVLLKPWIIKDRGHLSCYDVAIAALVAGGEGMLPPLVERLAAPVFYPFNLRNGNRLRRLAPC